MYWPLFSYGCSLEINSQRTAAYIDASRQAGKLPGQFELKCDCSPLFWSLNNDDNWVPATYINPATDDAPWYDSLISESGGFLGFMIENVEQNQSIASRSVTTRISASGGGVLGPLRSKERRLDFTVLMFAETEDSMEYGFRYLTDALTAPGCNDGCTLCDAEFRDSCPQVDGLAASLDKGRWLLKNVGTVEGPVWGAHPLAGSACNLRRVTFSLVSEFPWKFKCPVIQCENLALAGYLPDGVNCVNWSDILCGQQEVSCSMSENLIIGETGMIIEVKAGNQALEHIEISIRPDKFGYECNKITRPAGYIRNEPCDQVVIPYIPANGRFIYDTSIESAVLIMPGGSEYNGIPYVSTYLGNPPTFPTLRCGNFCISVAASECSTDNATVTISSVHREI